MEEKELNPFALISFILSFLFPPLGLVFGIIALVQISKNERYKGKGFAIAGVIISSVILAVFLLMLASVLVYLSTLPLLPDTCDATEPFTCYGLKVEEDTFGTSDTLTLTIKAEGITEDASLNKFTKIAVNGKPCLFGGEISTSLINTKATEDIREFGVTFTCVGELGEYGDPYDVVIDLEYQDVDTQLVHSSQITGAGLIG